MIFEEKLAINVSKFDEMLNTFFTNNFSDIPKNLAEVMKYAFLSGGKRLRPLIFLENIKSYGIDFDLTKFAIAIESMHTYSLVHDDLPCMDNDMLRRGMPTAHAKFGEGLALLAGDALLNLSFELLTETLATYNNTNIALAVKYFATRTGSKGMIKGQALDTSSHNENMTKEEFFQIYCKKTAELLKTAIICPAIIANIDSEQIQLLENFADSFGIAYQLRDDLIELENNEVNDETTFLSIFGEKITREYLQHYIEVARTSLDGLTTKLPFLAELTDYSFSRKK